VGEAPSRASINAAGETAAVAFLHPDVALTLAVLVAARHERRTAKADSVPLLPSPDAVRARFKPSTDAKGLQP
jgi:hypothetical protein